MRLSISTLMPLRVDWILLRAAKPLITSQQNLNQLKVDESRDERSKSSESGNLMLFLFKMSRNNA